MADKKTFADRKYDKRIPYKPSPESKAMAEKYVAPAILAGMSLIPVGGGAAGAMSRLSRPSPAKIVKDSQSSLRRFSTVNRADKVTKMKDRKGLERKDPMEPRVVPSGRSPALQKAREGGGGVTKMKDRRGLEIKQPERKAEAPPSRGFGKKVAKAGAATGAIVGGYYGAKELAKRREARGAVAQDRAKPTDFEKAYQSVGRGAGTDRPVMERKQIAPARVKARPADLKDSYKKPEKKKAEKRKPERKSKVRIAFEKEFAAARKAGKKKFRSKLGKYGSYSTELK